MSSLAHPLVAKRLSVPNLCFYDCEVRKMIHGQFALSCTRRWLINALVSGVTSSNYMHPNPNEMQLVGGEVGPTDEVIISQTWCPFTSNLRFLLKSFNIPHQLSLTAMFKLAYLAIIEYAPMKPVIIFVCSRKPCHLTVDDLLVHCTADGELKHFLNIEEAGLQPYLAHYYEGKGDCYVDYPVMDVPQEVPSRGLPIESHPPTHLLHDYFMEIAVKTIENKQNLMDILTWTFFHCRLMQNLNYYNLPNVSHQHLSDHLSELVENMLQDLINSKCIAIGMYSSVYHFTH
ncbi:hypothetical protein EDC04DRAFT_2604124 [Pisolithus marmoratus]|nr:hypothetical protein EDC04DRAFT_2604124 [Pisolithus marmoratus]